MINIRDKTLHMSDSEDNCDLFSDTSIESILNELDDRFKPYLDYGLLLMETHFETYKTNYENLSNEKKMEVDRINEEYRVYKNQLVYHIFAPVSKENEIKELEYEIMILEKTLKKKRDRLANLKGEEDLSSKN